MSEVKIEIKEQARGYYSIPPPSMEVPFDQRGPLDSIQNLEPYELASNPLADPYLVSEDFLPSKKDCCCFILCRGPTYALGFIWGLLSMCFAGLSYLLCCCKTYEVLSDEELTLTFQHKWPLSSFISKEKKEGKLSFVFHAEEYEKLKGVLYPEYKVEAVTATWDEDWRLQTIKVGKSTYSSEDEKLTNAWSLAKLHVMLVAQNKLRFGTHPYWHFVQHAWFHMLKKVYPAEHLFHQFATPHLRHAAMTDNNVSVSSGSVLNSRESACCCWDLLMTNRDGIQGLIRHNSRNFPPLMRKAPTEMLQPYYAATHKFVGSVLKEKWTSLSSKEEVEKRKTWYKGLSHYLGYPESLDPESPEDLTLILTQFIFSVSVIHSAEHYLYDKISIKAFPMTLKADVSKASYLPPCCCSGRVISVWDSLKTIMYYNMFTRWWRNYLCCCFSDSRLSTTKYSFEEDSKCKEAAEAFRAELEAGEKTVKDSYPIYSFPISKSARSIEF